MPISRGCRNLCQTCSTTPAQSRSRAEKISLTAERRADDVEVRVRDTGIGIPRESLPRIFQMFTQVDALAGALARGLGIG